MDRQTTRIWLVMGSAALIGVLANYLQVLPYILILPALWLGFFGFFWMLLGSGFSFIQVHYGEALEIISATIRGNSNMSQMLILLGLVRSCSNVFSAMFAGWAVCALLWDNDPHSAFVGFGLCLVVMIGIKWIAEAYLQRHQ